MGDRRDLRGHCQDRQIENCPGERGLTLVQILMGQKVTVVRCEEINCSGSFFRNKLKYADYLHSMSSRNASQRDVYRTSETEC